MREKKLYEHDPKTLGFETLGKLQSALIGRLVLVNMELKARLSESASQQGRNGSEATSFHLSPDQLDGFNLVLDHLLVSAARNR